MNNNKKQSTPKSEQQNKIGTGALVALSVSSVIGGGVFNLMGDVAQVSAVGPVIIGLLISGLGMGLFVFSLQNLHNKLPDLDAGIYSYAEHSFGRFVGFISAMGYWLSVFLGNVAFATIMMSALSHFFPIFGNGQNVASVIGASVILWIMHYIILNGTGVASAVNNIITIAKLIPLGLFILIVIYHFDADIFTQNFWGTTTTGFNWSEVSGQTLQSMFLIVWVFLGLEGTMVYSSRAKSKKTVARANVISFAVITAIYLLATVLSYGVFSQEQLAAVSKPAMAAVIAPLTGKWGSALINFGVFVSGLGAWFACTMFSGEILYQAARDGIFPKFFASENAHGAPAKSLTLSNVLVQVFLLLLLVNESAYNFMAVLASNTMLIAYLFVCFAQIKVTWQLNKKDYKNLAIGFLATLYMFFCIFASGVEYLLLTSLLFAPGLFIYNKSRQENNIRTFGRHELVSSSVILFFALLSLVFIASGRIDLTTL